MQEPSLPAVVALLFLFLAGGGLATQAEGQEARALVPGVGLEFREWDVPWEDTRPRDAYRAPDGTVFFAGQLDDYLGHLDPQTGEVRRFELPEGAGPQGLVVDPDIFVWYAGNGDGHIGRLDPATGEVLRYDLPDGVPAPHTLVRTLTGDLWFTAGGAGEKGFVGRLSPSSGEVSAVAVPGDGTEPHGIALDDEDRPWFALHGTNAIGTVDPGSLEVELVEVLEEASRIRRIGLTSDGRVWFVDGAGGLLGVHDPATGEQDQWLSPGGAGASPHALAVDDLDRVWFVESGMDPVRFVGFDPVAEEFFALDELPSGGGTVRHMGFWLEDVAIWFATDAHTIGRAVVPR